MGTGGKGKKRKGRGEEREEEVEGDLVLPKILAWFPLLARR